jgi:leucyl-tRNA synthetase
MHYDHRRIEEKWQNEWRTRGTYRVIEDPSKPKYYVLDMFPYPSGAGLHVGHPLGYIASDIVARHKRQKGFCVLHPMGYDAFGLPAEQYAIQTGQHPAVTTETNIKRYREQLDRIGFSFDWSREVRTSDPSYYKWTQWIFLQLFNSWYDPRKNKAEPIETLIEHFELQGYEGARDPILTGDIEEEIDAFTAKEWRTFDERTKQRILQNFRLAYLSEAWVNWCAALGTVLANDEVKDGVSERGGHPVERKRMPQWSLRITTYAQRLLDGLETLDWTESIKEAQRNWIGRSEGALVRFPLSPFPGRGVGGEEIEVFTTRPDTLFGVTFVTLAPEHELVQRITTADRMEEVMAYVNTAKNRSERERQADVKKVSGVFTGAYCVHPFTGEKIPVWVGDYVLSGYGTGAVMAVPGGDQRDWNFAKHFGLPIIAVTEGAHIEKEADERKDATIINSGFLNGLAVPQAISRAIDELVELGAGERRINYRLRDAAFGRQRYWGEPIPIYYKDDVPYPVKEEHLPIVLPEVDKYQPTESGEPPLARAQNWTYSPLLGRGAGGEAGRGVQGETYPLETTTMPGWAGSSWYFLRYMDPKNSDRFASAEKVDYWKQVDLYMGGAEHATGHLLYFRFWTKFLFDRGWIPFDEPAQKLVNQGMIQGVSAFVWSLANWQRKDISIEEWLSMSTYSEKFPDVFFASKQKTALESLGILEHELKLRFSKYDESVAGWDLTFKIGLGRVPIDYVDDKNNLKQEEYNRLHRERGSKRPMEFISDENGVIDCIREPEKMSKSKFNVVNPEDIIEKYGADTLRLYEMFLGPIEQSKPWDTNGIEGTSRFLRKFWNLFHDEKGEWAVVDHEPTPAELKVLHATIKKVTEDIDRMSFNTSVSQFMIAVNQLGDLKCRKRSVLEPLVIILSPFAPHITEEIWHLLGHGESITTATWPAHDEKHLVEDSFSYPISFNGKTRLQLQFPIALTKEEVEAAVLADPEVQQRLEGKPPKKVIVVPKRIVNIVV